MKDNAFRPHFLANKFQSHDGDDEGSDEEQAPKRGGFVKDENAHQHRADSADSATPSKALQRYEEIRESGVKCEELWRKP